MPNNICFDFYKIGKNGCPLFDVPIETIVNSTYTKAVKSFQSIYPKFKKVDVFWVKDGIENCKEQKLPI